MYAPLSVQYMKDKCAAAARHATEGHHTCLHTDHIFRIQALQGYLPSLKCYLMVGLVAQETVDRSTGARWMSMPCCFST